MEIRNTLSLIFGGVFIFRITFFDKIPNDVINKLIDLNLPDEVIELLSCTNGLIKS